MNPKRALAGLLAVLQAALCVPLAATRALAQTVVIQTGGQAVVPTISATPVPLLAPLSALGGIGGAMTGVSLSPLLPGGGAAVPVVARPIQTWAAGTAALALPISETGFAPVVAGLSTPAPLTTPIRGAGTRNTSLSPVLSGKQAASTARVAAEVGETTLEVGKLLASPSLSADAPSETSRGGAEGVFSTLRRERLSASVATGFETPSPTSVALRSLSAGTLSPAASIDGKMDKAPVPLPEVPADAATAPKRWWQRPAVKWGAFAAAWALKLAALPLLIAHIGTVAAVGSVVLSVIGIPQIVKNFKAGREGAKDLSLASPLIWFAAAVLLSVVSIGQGASLAWNIANLAGVIESGIVVAQLNAYKRDPKALKATLLTAAAVLAPIPLIAMGVFMPLSAWVGASFAVAMGLLWILNWPQIRANYKLWKAEGRPPKGIAPLYPGLLILGSWMHLLAAFVGGDVRWAMNAIVAIVTASVVLGQLYFPKATNAFVGPLVRLTDRVFPDKQARLERKARKALAPLFEGLDLAALAGTSGEAKLAAVLEKAKALPGRSVLYLEAPTAAGKSTLAAGLEKVLGSRIKVFPVDRYFKPRGEVPTAADGQPDFDRPEALDLDRVARDIRTLLAGGKVELPLHDMATETTRYDSGEFLTLAEGEVLVVDSIYASHDKLLAAAEGRSTLNLYLHAPTVVRFARRLKRDELERGIPLQKNLQQWGNILIDEAAYILPLRAKADETLELVEASELLGLPDAYARLLAAEWAARGQDETVTRLFVDRVRASLEADGLSPSAPRGPPKGGSDLKLRAVTGAGIVAALAGLVWLGGLPFAAFSVALSALMLRELAAMLKVGGRPVQPLNMIATGAAVAAATVAGLPAGLVLGAAAAWVLSREVTTSRSPERAAATLAGVVALGFLPAFLGLLRALPGGLVLTAMTFAAAFALDTGAYIVGRTLGRHKLAPNISPKKTWEGSVGGFLAALGVTLAFHAFFPAVVSLGAALAAGAVLGTIGQVSGLANSMIKRAMGVKDSGSLLPGHGGFLDRFDTFVLTAALLYALLG